MSQSIAVQQTSYTRTKSMTMLFALWLGHFAVDSFTGIWPIYKTIADLDLVKAGLIATIGGFVGNSLQIFFGMIGDRGWSRFLLCFGVLAAGTMVLVPYVDNSNYLLLGLIVMITYIGSSAYHPSGTGTASTLSAKSTGKLTAVFLSGGFIGYAFSQLLFTKVYQITEGKTAIMLFLSVSVAFVILFLSPAPVKQADRKINFFDATKGLRRPLTYLYIVMVCAAGVNMLQVFLLPDLLIAKSAPDWMVYGGGHLILVMGGCLGLLPAGHLADKYGPRQVMLGGLALVAVFMTITAIYETSAVLSLGLLLLLLGISSSTCNVVGVTYGNRLMPKHTRTVSGLLMGVAWCVAGVSTWIGGWLADPKNDGTPQNALLWFNVAVAFAFIFTYLLPRTKKSSK